MNGKLNDIPDIHKNLKKSFKFLKEKIPGHKEKIAGYDSLHLEY